MDAKQDFFNGCLPGNWVEAETTEISEAEKVVVSKRKDIAILLAELEEIKNTFERIEEKKIRLQNLMQFYRGGLTTT